MALLAPGLECEVRCSTGKWQRGVVVGVEDGGVEVSFASLGAGPEAWACVGGATCTPEAFVEVGMVRSRLRLRPPRPAAASGSAVTGGGGGGAVTGAGKKARKKAARKRKAAAAAAEDGGAD
jgi:hypothetical protein